MGVTRLFALKGLRTSTNFIDFVSETFWVQNDLLPPIFLYYCLRFEMLLQSWAKYFKSNLESIRNISIIFIDDMWCHILFFSYYNINIIQVCFPVIKCFTGNVDRVERDKLVLIVLSKILKKWSFFLNRLLSVYESRWI